MGYRGHLDQLEARRLALEEKRREIGKRLAEVAELEQLRSAIDYELREVAAAIDRVSSRERPTLRIASPCKAKWEEMIGDERVRFCGRCSKNVYDLSALTTDDAINLVTETEGALCVRLYRRRDGTVLTRDCATGISGRRKLYAAVAIATAGVSCAASSMQWESTLGGLDPDLEPVVLPENDHYYDFAPVPVEETLPKLDDVVTPSSAGASNSPRGRAGAGK